MTPEDITCYMQAYVTSVPSELHVIEAAAIHKVLHIPCCLCVGLLDILIPANFIMHSATNKRAYQYSHLTMFHGMLQIFCKNLHKKILKHSYSSMSVFPQRIKNLILDLRYATDFRELTSDQLKNSHCIPLGYSTYSL